MLVYLSGIEIYEWTIQRTTKAVYARRYDQVLGLFIARWACWLSGACNEGIVVIEPILISG